MVMSIDKKSRAMCVKSYDFVPLFKHMLVSNSVTVLVTD